MRERIATLRPRLAAFRRGLLRVLGPAVVIVVLVFLAWYVGVHTSDPPRHIHSLGVLAEAQGPGSAVGRNIPSGGPCHVCSSGTDIMRFNPGAGLRVDMVVSVHPTLSFPTPHCGDASVDLVISGTPAFWAQHDRLGPSIVTTRARVRGVGKGHTKVKVTLRVGPPVRTYIVIGWDGSTRLRLPPGVRQASSAKHSPALVVFYDDPQSALHPGFFTNGDLTGHAGDNHQTTVVAFPPRAPVGVRTQIYNWGYAVEGSKGIRVTRQWPLHLHFTANWVSSRGWGSCYVSLPSLLANGTFAGTQNALEALVHKAPVPDQLQVKLLAQAQPPSFGRVALSSSGSVSLPDTNPAPTDYEAVFVATGGSLRQRAREFAEQSEGRLGPVWECTPSDNLSYLNGAGPASLPPDSSFRGDSCGAIAVVEAAGAADIRGVVLIVLGVLIALAFERFFRRLRADVDADVKRRPWRRGRRPKQ